MKKMLTISGVLTVSGAVLYTSGIAWGYNHWADAGCEFYIIFMWTQIALLILTIIAFFTTVIAFVMRFAGNKFR